MMFRRRIPLSRLLRIREFIWPSMGIGRSLRYLIYRVLRLPGSAHAIAGGLAWGVAISFTPFLGLHFILSGLGALATRCSFLAAIIGTSIGNPWTFPFIWTLIYFTGTQLMGIEPKDAPAVETLATLFNELWQLGGKAILVTVGLAPASELAGNGALFSDVFMTIFLPMLVGSLPIALVVWIAFYIPLRRMVLSYQNARQRRRKVRAKTSGAGSADVPHIGDPHGDNGSRSVERGAAE